jgi:hypothetical protein
VIVTGSAGLVAFSTSTGADLWADGYTAASGEVGNGVAVSPDSSTVFVTGQIRAAPQLAYWTVAYNAGTGAVIWSARYEGLGYSRATSVGVSPNGSAVFVTGTTEASPAPTGTRVVTLAYNPATGARLWLDGYPGGQPNGTQFTSPSLAVAPDASTVAVTAGRALKGEQTGYATLAYNAATGRNELTAIYQVAGNVPSTPADVAVSQDSSTAFVTGWSGLTSGIGYPASYLTIGYRI